MNILHKYKIRIDTMKEAEAFVQSARNVNATVLVKDDDGHCVNGKSVLGMLYALEFNELWCETDSDATLFLTPFLVGESY